MFCTNCGAEIADQQRFCGNCGYAVVNSENERNIPLEVVKRDLDEAKRMGEELDQIVFPLTNLGICMQKAEVEKKNIERIQAAIDRVKKGNQNVELKVLLIVSWAGMCLNFMLETARVEWIILAVVGSLIIYKLCSPNAKKAIARYQQEYDTSMKRYDELQQGCAINMRQCMPVLEKYLSRDYWYMDAVSRISGYLRNGRAESIKEAINLYEEESHRMRMENLQYRTLVENQKQTVHTGILAAEAIARLL